jgi:PEP-CTERM motif
MKLTSAALLTFLFVLGALCPRAAEANAVKVVIPPDPTCGPGGTAPEGYTAVSTETNDTTAPSGPYVTIDATGDESFDFINCTGTSTTTIPDLFVYIDILQGSLQPITFDVTGVFNVIDDGSISSTELEYELICDQTVSACTGLTPGEAGAVYVPEPSTAALLLFGIGICFLGFNGRKRWSVIRPNWACHGRLTAS